MRACRRIIRPNDGFWRQLIQYEKQLRKNKVITVLNMVVIIHLKFAFFGVLEAIC